MTKALAILTATILFFACSTKQPDPERTYYVIKHPAPNTNNTRDIPPPPPPPTIFYGDHNFILLDTSKIFYHDKHRFYWCGTGIDETKPPRLNLTPDSLKEIKMNDLHNFLLAHIPDSILKDPLTTHKWVMVSISSTKDTIKSRAFDIIHDYIKLKNIRRYVIRNLTEEENYVTVAKVLNKKYDPKSVDWKLGFDSVDTLVVRIAK